MAHLCLGMATTPDPSYLSMTIMFGFGIGARLRYRSDMADRLKVFEFGITVRPTYYGV